MQEIYNYIKTKILTKLAEVGKSLNFAPGDVIDTIVLYVSDGVAKVIDYATMMMRNAFFATADAEFLYRKCDDFNILYSLGAFATGTVRFTRTENAEVEYVIPSGTLVSTNKNRFQGYEFFTTAEAVMLIGTSSIEAPVQAVIPGSDYNVLAGTIRFLSQQVTGIEEVVQDADITGGTDQDTLDEVRDKALGYIRNIGRGTRNALIYRARSVTGVKYISLTENPKGTLLENHDSTFISYTGTWAEIENASYYMGKAMSSSTADDEMVMAMKVNGFSKYQPVFDGDCIVDVYLNNVFVESITEPKEFSTEHGEHTVKLVLRQGTINFDGIKLYSAFKRHSVVHMIIDDGTGTASWALMNSVKTTLQSDWRACGVLAYYDRTEIQLVDLEIEIQWEPHASKSDVKGYAETELGTWLSNYAPNSLIRMCNVIPIILPVTVSGRRQVICVKALNNDIQLAENTVARLNNVIWKEIH